MDILRFKPRAYWKLDNTSPYTDYAGYSKTATLAGTEQRGASLTTNCSFSQTVDSTRIITFGHSPFVNDKSIASFSLAVTMTPIYPTSTNAEQQVLSSPGQMDGITINGNTIYFTTIHKTTGSARCSYTLDYSKRVTILGVHTYAKNSLYIDGELVSEVDVTPEQALDAYLTTPTTLISGTTSSTQAFLLNEVAIYESALDGAAAKTIYDDQTRGFIGNVPSTFGGDKVALSTAFRVPALAYSWTDAEDWDHAMQVNCIVDEDQLIPETRNGLSLDAQWITSVNMYNGSTVLNVSEINVDYTGFGAVVSISFDGMNWTVINGSLAQSFNPFKKDLYVKVDFAAGLDGAYLDNLYINLYTTNTVTTQSGKVVTYNIPATALREYPVQQLHAKWGVDIDTGGSVVVAHTSSIASVEYWIKMDANGLISDFRPMAGTSGTYYLNGVAVANTFALKAGIWYHVVIVETTARADYTLKPGANYGMFAVYESLLTATQAANIYREYNGPITTTTSDTNALAVTENSTPALIYNTDYAVIGGSQ